jgi:hypothetical protein
MMSQCSKNVSRTLTYAAYSLGIGGTLGTPANALYPFSSPCQLADHMAPAVD